MDLGVTMGPEVLEDKLDDVQQRGRQEAIWNTKNLPKRLTPGWTNRLFVACRGKWVGWFPLSGELLWNPEDEGAPYGLVFQAAKWTRIAPVPAPRFRGWRYLEVASDAAASAPTRPGSNSFKNYSKNRANSAESPPPSCPTSEFPHCP